MQVLESTEGDVKGGLAASMDHCVTAAGRRKLRAWLCQPLGCPKAIQARQDAVQDLMGSCCEAAGAARRQFAGVLGLKPNPYSSLDLHQGHAHSKCLHYTVTISSS